MEDAPNRRWTRAIILANLGRRAEALDELNRLIEDQPGYDGYRYYLRALIEYDLGDLEAAREDLEIGAANTWGRSGLYPYVEGLLAQDEGDVDQARQDFQLAEASLLRRYGPIIDRIRSDLARLDGERLVVTPSTFVEVTPNPTLVPSPTPRTLPDHGPLPPWTRTFDLSQGTGPLVVRATDEPTFRFQPARPIDLTQVVSLEVILEPLLTVPEPEIKIYIWSSKGEWGRIEDAVWGSNAVHVPAESILSDGSVVVSLRLRNPNPAFIRNLSVRYTAQLADGTTGTFGAPGN